MFKKNDKWIMLCVLVGIIGLCFAARLLLPTSNDSQIGIATITSFDKVIEVIDLSKVDSTYTLVIDNQNGGSNTVEVSPEGIRIIDGTCPDQLCVKHGYVHANKAPAVCLPNGLIIEVHTEEAPAVDAYAN